MSKVITKNEYIAVLGYGNSGMAMAAYLTAHGYKVKLWNRTFKNIDRTSKRKIIVAKGVINGEFEVALISDNIEDVLKNVRLVLITTPADAHDYIADIAAPFLNDDNIIVLNPGRTWGALTFYLNIKKKNPVLKNIRIAETQTILFTCRKKNQFVVKIIAIKKDVLISALQKDIVSEIIDILPKALSDSIIPAAAFPETSLGNVGMILHCAPVLLNTGWVESKKQFMYYRDGISETIAGFLEKIDAERLEVGLKLGYVIPSVKEWIFKSYGVSGKNLYEAIGNVESYYSIKAPDSLNHRYINEDILTGLVPLEFLGKEMGLEMKYSGLIIDLANALMNKDFRSEGRKMSLKKLQNYL